MCDGSNHVLCPHVQAGSLQDKYFWLPTVFSQSKPVSLQSVMLLNAIPETNLVNRIHVTVHFLRQVELHFWVLLVA